MILEDYISTERLRIYTDILKLRPDEALGGYNWNKALCSAMQPLMHCLEVTLRNSIDHAVRSNSHSGVSGWRTDSNWIFDLPRYMGDQSFIRQNKRYKKDRYGNLLDGKGGRSLNYDRTAWEEDSVRKVSQRIKKAGKTPDAARVISGLDFGFWSNLLTPAYQEPRNNSLLWPHLLPYVFPGLPAGTGRHVIEKKFERIREIRNRLAHHEAIWKFQFEDPATGKPDYTNPVYGLSSSLGLLKRAWDDMLEALSWVSPTRHAAFLSEGHHKRFETLATKHGLLSFIGRTHIPKRLNARRSVKHLLRNLENGHIIRVTDRSSSSRTIAIIGPDFIRL
ncbi:Abi family protein [Aeromonas sp. BIGb0445]|uniref:Abi family protein n=1 Tax=Aeromonas sp. BIGb0445 TaxID=2940593 RepID=UPI002168A5A5|nr:Abi family protein [Aeromonas sp. BIGb0445]MCS3461629.1 hypothetical protein [Aeromonas sp. BIGb0445]